MAKVSEGHYDGSRLKCVYMMMMRMIMISVPYSLFALSFISKKMNWNRTEESKK